MRAEPTNQSEDGLTPSQRWRKRNPEKQEAATRSWRERHREQVAGHQRAYRKRHPGKVKEGLAAWHAKNPAYEKERAKRRYAADPARQYAATRKWEQKHPEKVIDARRRYSQSPVFKRNHIAAEARRQAAKRGATGVIAFNAADWERIKAKYDGRCAYCFDLTIKPDKDHVMALSRGGQHAVSNIVPACRQCNSSKKNKLLMDWLFPDRKGG